MKIGKYISELLFENDFVILPDLGEFSTKYIPAKFIPELKKVESPSKVITFNEKNKSGGGLLTEYIARKEGIGSQQAKEFVNNFVVEMQNSLRSGKKVELENVGVFSMDEDGSLVFEPDTSINYLSDSMGMTSVKEPARKSEEEAKSELDKVIENAKKDAAAQIPESTSASDVPPKSEEQKKSEGQTKASEEKLETKPDATPYIQKPAVPVRPLTSEPVRQKTVSSKREPQQAPPKQGLPPALKWVAFTVVPLLIIIIVLALNFEYIFGDKSVFKDREEPETTEISRETTPSETPVVEEETQPEETAYDPTVPPPAPESGRKVYYIIIGSFEEEHSALILAEELRSEGARTASVFPVNRLGFYRVSYGYYYDLQEAERDLERAKQINPEAWILHR